MYLPKFLDYIKDLRRIMCLQKLTLILGKKFIIFLWYENDKFLYIYLVKNIFIFLIWNKCEFIIQLLFYICRLKWDEIKVLKDFFFDLLNELRFLLHGSLENYELQNKCTFGVTIESIFILQKRICWLF